MVAGVPLMRNTQPRHFSTQYTQVLILIDAVNVLQCVVVFV